MRLNGLKQIWDWTNLGLNKIEIVQLELGSAYLEMWKDIINNDIIIKESFIEQSFIILLSYYYMSIKSLA